MSHIQWGCLLAGSCYDSMPSFQGIHRLVLQQYDLTAVAIFEADERFLPHWKTASFKLGGQKLFTSSCPEEPLACPIVMTKGL